MEYKKGDRLATILILKTQTGRADGELNIEFWFIYNNKIQKAFSASTTNCRYGAAKR